MKRELRWKTVDNYKRKLFLKIELKRFLLNSIIKNAYLPRSYRYYALFSKTKLSRINSSVQHKNKCVKTGRVWSVINLTKYSRFVFRTESYAGHLPGFKRASW